MNDGKPTHTPHPFDGAESLPLDIWDDRECGTPSGWWIVPAVVVALVALAWWW